MKKSELRALIREVVEEVKKMENPCWKGYKAYGTKNKGGKEVPNCVPVKEEYATSGVDYTKQQMRSAIRKVMDIGGRNIADVDTGTINGKVQFMLDTKGVSDIESAIITAKDDKLNRLDLTMYLKGGRRIEKLDLDKKGIIKTLRAWSGQLHEVMNEKEDFVDGLRRELRDALKKKNAEKAVYYTQALRSPTVADAGFDNQFKGSWAYDQWLKKNADAIAAQNAEFKRFAYMDEAVNEEVEEIYGTKK